MSLSKRLGVSRVAVLIGVLVGCAALAVAGLYAHKWRKSNMVTEARRVGLAAYESGDWETARMKLGQYLSVHKQDVEILHKYADAQLLVEPLPSTNIAQAIGAYRRVLRSDPQDQRAFDRLVRLYLSTQNYAELGYIAKKRLESSPSDAQAELMACRVQFFRQEAREARSKLRALYDRLIGDASPGRTFAECALLLAEQTLREDEPASPERALELLMEATGRLDKAPLLKAYQSVILAGMARRSPSDAEDHLADAKAILTEAEVDARGDARAMLAVAQQWAQLGGYDRALELLEAAAALPRDAVRLHYLDPQEWRMARLSAEASIYLDAPMPEKGAALAQEIVETFDGDRRYSIVLPMVTRLYCLAGKAGSAQTHLDEYIAELERQGVPLAGNATVAMLRALIAEVEDRPYEVIAQLEPLVKGGQKNALITKTLSQAYGDTEQFGRMQALFAKGEAGLPSAFSVLQMARMAVADGEWSEALRLLADLEPEGPAAVEIELTRLGAQLGIAIAAGRVDEDVPALIQAIRAMIGEHPKRADLRVLLASMLETQGNASGAEEALEEAIATTDEPLRAYTALARLQTSEDRPEDAVATLRKACNTHGDVARPWLLLAARLVGDGDPDAARSELQAALESVEGDVEQRMIRSRLAILDVLDGNVDDGVKALRSLAAEDPHDIDIRRRLLQIPSVLGDAELAQQLVDQIRVVEGETGIQWRVGQARVWLSGPAWAERVAEIERLLKYCMEADPTQTDAFLLLGQMYERQGRFDEAERTYSVGVELNDGGPLADRLLALLQRQGRYAEARDLLERIESNLDQRAASARRLSLALESRAVDDAIAELELRTSRESAAPLDLVRLASLVYVRDGAFDRAMELLDEATRQGVLREDVARVRVAIMLDEGQVEQAEALLDSMVSSDPNPRALMLRAAFRMRNGQPELAEADYERLFETATDEMGPAMLGEFYAQRGDLDKAIETWTTGLTEYPDSILLRRGVCRALLTRGADGDLARMGTLLEELRDLLGQETVDSLWMGAARLERLDVDEHRDEIVRMLDQALDATPTGEESFVGVVDVAVRLGELERARSLAQRGMATYPRGTVLKTRRASVEMMSGNPDVAAELAQDVLDEDPDDGQALRLLVTAAAQGEDTIRLRDALRRIESQLAEAPEDWGLQFLRAETLAALDRPADAIEGLRGYLPDVPADRRVSVLLALANLSQELNDRAGMDRYIEMALEVSPDAPEVLVARMRLWAVDGRFDALADFVSTYVAAEDRSGPVMLEAARLLSASREHLDLAMRACAEAIVLMPQSGAAQRVMGDLRYTAGDLAGAEAAYRRVVELDADDPEARNNLAWVLASRDDASNDVLKEAYEHAHAAVLLSPDSANYRDTMATVLRRLGRLDEARDEFMRVADLAAPDSPDRALAMLNIARVNGELEEWQAASEYLDRALAMRDAIKSADGVDVFSPADEREISAIRQAVQRN